MISLQSRTLPIAHPGPTNPLPMVTAALESPYAIAGDLPSEIINSAGYGHPANLYPYQLQDGYDRDRTENSLQTIVLENERLRAVILPELGGRVWELFDKVSGKPLLYTQPEIQFANLGLRNAWFAGGIEWNIATRGHSPTTCSPLHTAILRTPDGEDVVRMWEFDRLRQVVFQIDLWLPEDSAILLAAIRIRNPNALDVPMYWWTNAAVPESESTRVLAPAESAFASDYTGSISRVTPADDDDIDCTWPTRNPQARDFFFDLPQEQRRWVLAADADGDGLAMLSTTMLRGRKLFVWGQGAGGQRWQDWLSPTGGRYAEIQAGLAHTQYQHLAMPAEAEWSWLEAYGNAALDPDAAHNADWAAATRHGGERIDTLAGQEELDEWQRKAAGWADLAPQQQVVTGSGWGALETARRTRHGLPWLETTGTPFPDVSVTVEQEPWRELLYSGTFSAASTFVAGDDWDQLLAAAEPTANALLHRAVIAHAAGDQDAAAQLYSASLVVEASAAAHRGLAVLALGRDDRSDAVAHYLAACSLEPDNSALLVEAVAAHLPDDPDGALGLIERAGDVSSRSGRVAFLTALALAHAGRDEDAAELLHRGIEVADLREGENSITALWLRVCPGEDVPLEYQFSMH